MFKAPKCREQGGVRIGKNVGKFCQEVDLLIEERFMIGLSLVNKFGKWYCCV